jgi:hypothetical protein
MSRIARISISLVAVLVAAAAIPLGWMTWRDHRVRTFCNDIHAGMTLSRLFELEESHGIDGTYLFPFRRDSHTSQQETRELAFVGAAPGDPNFECVVEHDGAVVTVAKLVPE